MTLTEHKFIVFCQEHYNPLGIIRSLGEKGIHPIVIVVKGGATVASKSKYISKLYYVDSLEEGYRLLLERYGCESECRPFLLTSDDTITSYLDAHYEELKGKFYFFNGGQADRLGYYMNKDNINQLAIKHGLNVLHAVVAEKGEIPADLEYPVITKAIASTVGGWKEDVFVCHNAEELKKAYEKIISPVVLLQKYIVKKNEHCMEGFSVDQGRKVFVSIASNYNYLLKSAYSPYMTVRNFDDPELQKKINAMMEEIGFEGIFEIEFLISQDGTLYFCEINFRNSTWSYASTCAGMNLPYLWAEGMLTKQIRPDTYQPIHENFNAMVDFPDFKNRVIGRMISPIQWFKEWKSADCTYYYNKRDPKPFWFYLFSKATGIK